MSAAEDKMAGAPRPAFTHFLCIQLVTPASRTQLADSLATFKADVTSPASFDIPVAAVRPLGTLHLTLGMMSLPDGEGLARATALLRELKPREILRSVTRSATSAASKESQGPSEILMTLRGLRSMQAPTKSSVLYAPPEDPQGVLQAFSERVREPFLEQGSMVREDRPLLLHATIVNTIYVKSKGRQGKKGKLTIDATDMMERYDGYTWMRDVKLEKIAICRMGAKPVEGEDEAAYGVEEEVSFE